MAALILLLAVLSVTARAAFITLPVTAILALCLFLFHSLTVEIGGGALECRFGPGWPRKRIPLSEVREVQAVRNRWWYGWGIRLVPGSGWMFNISGLDAVQVTLADGRRFRIGTDEPRRLERAIRRGIE